MKKLFITATGTDIGKTFVTAALAHQARTAGLSIKVAKPIISGFAMADAAVSDTGILLASTGQPLTPHNIDACSPWRFAAPLSPDMAAAREGCSIDFAALVDWAQAFFTADADLALMEGVGGVMVPLDATHTVRELIIALDVPVMLVAGTYLGTISHTLTALAALAPVLPRILLSESADSPVPPAETAAVLQRFTAADISILPRAADWQIASGTVLQTVLDS
jgi:dethiobiotin synthetase